MPHDAVVVQCPNCRVKVKVPSTRSEMSCPKCSQTFNVAQATRSNPTKRKRPSSPPSRLQGKQNHSTTVEGSVPALGFYSYFTKHWQQSHGHWLLPIFFTSLLAVPILSFIKPAIGFHGQLYAVAGLLGLSITSFLVYSVQRLLGYYFGGDRTIPEDTTSKLAAFAYSGVILTIFPLGPLVAVEYVMPERGLLANFVPPVAEQQTKLLAKLNLAGTKETVALATASSNGGEDESSNATVSEVTLASKAQGDTSKSTNRSTTPTTSVTTTSNPKEMVVIAEGVGKTSDEALKDAFRNAVRQVVGAVVDAETLIENDEIISDKILTYSDGFISEYDLLSESKRGGLFRKKIKTTVERRSVIARLKAANITVSNVDGKGLFAEVVTQLDAEKNAKVLVQKALAGFPLNCLQAKVIGKPEIVDKDESKVRIRITVSIQVDLPAYDAFVARLRETLKGIAKEKGEFSMRASEDQWTARMPENSGLVMIAPYFPSWVDQIPCLISPATSGRGAKYSENPVVALNTQRTKKSDRTEWNYYMLDKSARQVLVAAYRRRIEVKMSLLDENNQILLVDRFGPELKTKNGRGFNDYRLNLITNEGNLGQKALLAGRNDSTALFLVSPFFFSQDNHSMVVYMPKISISRTVSMTLDELKEVQSVNCELLFKGP